ncbi:hypothetical protein ABZW02_25740 [Streptomyces sp. NPDC005180]|uniref:hypothetical protein n=1 Tax=Streptomyces sp. NPDC005180 TaxID=3156868 RepID=UPI0033B7CDFA
MTARESLIAHTASLLWQAWAGSSEDMASQAAATLTDLGMLVPEGGAAELARLRARVTELEAVTVTVTGFCAQRAEYVTNLRNCNPNADHDYYRWSGHAAARRQLSQLLGLPVGWPNEENPTAVAEPIVGTTRELTQKTEDPHSSLLHHEYKTARLLEDQ